MTNRELLTNYPRYLAFGFLHYFFSFVGQTFFISLFVTGITAERGWETETFAGIYSGVTLCAAFLLPVIGGQLDRLRVRYVSTTTVLVMIAGCLLLAYGHGWLLLALGILCVRLGGQGVLTLTGSTTIGRFFERGRGKALSYSMLGICAAEIIVPLLAVYLIQEQGYRSTWLVAAALLAMVFLPAIWLLVSRHDNFQKAATIVNSGETSSVASWTRRQVISDPRFQLIVPIVLFIPFFFTGFVFNQTDIGELRGFSPELMALGLSTFGLTRAFCILFAGQIVDRFGPAKLLIVVLLPAVMGMLVFWSFPGGWTIPVIFGLIAVSAGVITVTMPTLWADRYGPQFLGSIKSTVKLLEVLSSAGAPILFSWGLKSLGLSTWMALMIGYGLACVLLAVLERRRQ
ncbi:MFS transporter [Lewinellaceae bacterium SD302]|nr:MFS transporter [Lewinellaceae bacterium SD302]